MAPLVRLLVLVLLLAGAALAPAPARADLVDLIRERGTLRVGMAESPPWQAPDPETGRYEGFNVDLAQRVADLMEVELEIVPETWSTLIPGLKAGRFDVVFANLFATPKRALSVSFTEPYATYGFHVAVAAEGGAERFAALEADGVTFAALAGSAEERHARELFPAATVLPLAGGGMAAALSAVSEGRAEAALVDPGTFRIVATRDPDLVAGLRLVNGEDALLKPVGLSYAVRPEDVHMLHFLDTFIRDLVGSGEARALRDRWFEKLARSG